MTIRFSSNIGILLHRRDAEFAEDDWEQNFKIRKGRE
jgi:hypothetical protein